MNDFSSAAALPLKSPAFSELPAKLFVETTTYCNLACPMCVKQAPESGIIDGHLSPQTFAALEPAFPTLQALVLNGIGEPLLHPQLESFVFRARRAMPETGWVGFQSNGLLLNERRALALTAAGLDRICLSLDALSPETFRRMREGAEVDAIEAAFTALRLAKRTYPWSRLRVGVEFVVMRDNVRELPAVVRWAWERGADFALVTQMVPYEEKMTGQVAYDATTDAAAALLDKWRRKGAQAGVDIARYPAVAWRGGGSRERKVIELVEGMKAEARSRDVFLDVRQLFARDPALTREVAAIFAEATEVARDCGLDLRLPAVQPQQERRCAFVEDGGAFISWTGDVHPCYSLWHRYRCYINGWEKTIRPEVFGNLGAQSLDAIWNDGRYRSFRQGVLGYDYPFCSNCAVAPCDYVQSETFEQDCYVKAVPCGACLWPMGILQCLQ